MITVYTDGSCLDNPGLGAMGMVFTYKGQVIIKYGIPSYRATTNNRMELGAVVETLKRLPDFKEEEILIISDSNYVVRGVNEWLDGWRKKDFVKVKNEDLWRELDSLLPKFNVTLEWVRGHNGDHFNEMADQMAVESAKTQFYIEE